MDPLYVPETHLRLAEQPDGSLRISLSEPLLRQLGRPTWAEWNAEPGAELPPGVPFASVETEKTVYEVSLPFPAVFVALNPGVRANPSILRALAQGDGWLCAVRPAAGADWRAGLLDEAGYAAFVAP